MSEDWRSPSLSGKHYPSPSMGGSISYAGLYAHHARMGSLPNPDVEAARVNRERVSDLQRKSAGGLAVVNLPKLRCLET